MDENRLTERALSNCNLTMSDISNSNENGQIQESPDSTRCTLENLSPGTAFNFGVRTAERSRIFADNISSTIQGIRPLIQQAAVCIIATMHYRILNKDNILFILNHFLFLGIA